MRTHIPGLKPRLWGQSEGVTAALWANSHRSDLGVGGQKAGRLNGERISTLPRPCCVQRVSFPLMGKVEGGGLSLPGSHKQTTHLLPVAMATESGPASLSLSFSPSPLFPPNGKDLPARSIIPQSRAEDAEGKLLIRGRPSRQGFVCSSITARITERLGLAPFSPTHTLSAAALHPHRST